MLDELDPIIRDAANALVAAAAQAGFMPQVTSTVRTVGQQAALYRDYLQGRSQYPAAPPGRSAHNWGWAFDLSVTPYEALWPLGDLWERWGGTWGGHFGDPIHFEAGGASAWLASASESDLQALSQP